MTNIGNYKWAELLRGQTPVKSKVFVSYHHQRDQKYYDLFAELFADGYEILTDTSIDRKIGSDDVDYQQQVIREKHISGSSITVVLCGAETWKRRWVDWEIHMTLNKEHALLGICLPTNPRSSNGKFIVPDGLHVNIVTGYAHFIQWTENPQELKAAIEVAKQRARLTRNIDNTSPRMKRSRS
ncbi:MAG TPA: TIR domain-containing protein [Phycisphaerae bacterium]|nr:TIR domain-containing protein [Phycisphaerae bacterium]